MNPIKIWCEKIYLYKVKSIYIIKKNKNQTGSGFFLGPGHRDLYAAILIFVPAIFTLSLY